MYILFDDQLINLHMESYILRPFECLQCQRRFTTKLFLKRHHAVHSSIRNYRCELCLSTYKYKKGLNRHIKKFHPDYYSSLNLPPITRKPKIKFEENASPVFKIRRKTAEGWVEEIPAVTPTFKLHPDLSLEIQESQASSNSKEDLKASSSKKQDLSKSSQRLNYNAKDKKRMNFFKFFLEHINKQKEGKNENLNENFRKFGHNESFKEFNKVLSDTVEQYQTCFEFNGTAQTKGFVPVKIEKNSFRDKICAPNPHKRIEYLEELLRKFKTQDFEAREQLRLEKEKTEELSRMMKRLDRLYKLKMCKLRKVYRGVGRGRIDEEEKGFEMEMEGRLPDGGIKVEEADGVDG